MGKTRLCRENTESFQAKLATGLRITTKKDETLSQCLGFRLSTYIYVVLVIPT